MQKTSNWLSVNEDLLFQRQYLGQLNYNIDLLSNHIINIVELILIAKLGGITKFILNPQEQREVYDSKSIDIISDEHIYESISLQAYYNSFNTIFNFIMPVLSQESYTLFHIIPLPINKTKEIITKPYALFNDDYVQYFTEHFPQDMRRYYCQGADKQIVHRPTLTEYSCTYWKMLGTRKQ